MVLQVFPIQHLRYFTEEELERLLCGEHDSFAVSLLITYLIESMVRLTLLSMFILFLWQLEELLDHIKFDHGYTASSPPIINASVLFIPLYDIFFFCLVCFIPN